MYYKQGRKAPLQAGNHRMRQDIDYLLPDAETYENGLKPTFQAVPVVEISGIEPLTS